MKAKRDDLGFWRASAAAVVASLPFWIALGYGVYRVLKCLGY